MMPAWLSRTMVYAAWIVATAIGVLGYRLRRRGLLNIYGAYGLLALVHYALAPVGVHTARHERVDLARSRDRGAVPHCGLPMEVRHRADPLARKSKERSLTPFSLKGS